MADQICSRCRESVTTAESVCPNGHVVLPVPGASDRATAVIPAARRPVPWLAVALAAALLAAAGLLGYLLIGRGSADSTPSADVGRSSGPSVAQQATEPAGELRVQRVTAICASPNSKDRAGRTVGYEPQNVVDGDPQTAWRCPGDASGQNIELVLDGPFSVVEVGLIPGYAKTDPEDGADRFAESRTVDSMRWDFLDADGRVLLQAEQEIPQPSRSMARLVLAPPARATIVRAVIQHTADPTAVRGGGDHHTAISEITLRGYR